MTLVHAAARRDPRIAGGAHPADRARHDRRRDGGGARDQHRAL